MDTPSGQPGSLRIHEGDCWAFFAFDAGHGIQLDKAQAALRAAPAARDEEARRSAISHRRHAPRHLQFRPAPLQVVQSLGEIATQQIASLSLAPRVECTLYDFGAISVAYRIPIDGGAGGMTTESLLPLAQALGDGATLAVDARRRVDALTNRLAHAIERPAVVDLVEDYTVYHIRRWSPDSAGDALHSSRESVARLLLTEQGPLSQQAIDAALDSQLTYAPNDLAIIDWNAAMLLDAQAEDSLAILEFANVELLEMRFLDDRLDSILESTYTNLLRRDGKKGWPRSPLGFLIDPHRAERTRLAALQMESAILFENINNTLKLVSDQHLARLYSLAARRLHLADWDQSVLRKLHTIDGLYQKLADERAGRRMEVLEWIVIILIAMEGLIPFILHNAK